MSHNLTMPEEIEEILSKPEEDSVSAENGDADSEATVVRT